MTQLKVTNNAHKEPYVHQDFPRVMYRGEEQKLVKTAEDEPAAVEAGFSRTPPTGEVAAETKASKKAAKDAAK